MLVFFFFSSRRRHTRSLRDWSSDVCSSDLPRRRPRPARALFRAGARRCLAQRRQLLDRALQRRGGGDGLGPVPPSHTHETAVSPLTDGPAEQKSHYRRNLLIVSGGLALLALAWWGFKVWIH